LTNDIVLTTSIPIYGPASTTVPVGVVAIEVTSSTVNEHITRKQIATGVVFVLERNTGNLIATSSNTGVKAATTSLTNGTYQIVKATSTSNSYVAWAANLITANGNNAPATSKITMGTQQFMFSFSTYELGATTGNNSYIISIVLPYADFNGAFFF